MITIYDLVLGSCWFVSLYYSPSCKLTSSSGSSDSNFNHPRHLDRSGRGGEKS